MEGAESKGPPFFGLKTFFVVTGAANGLGRAVALVFASRFPPGSTLLLIDIDRDSLLTTRFDIENRHGSKGIKTIYRNLDLRDIHNLKLKFCMQDVFHEYQLQSSQFEQAAICHVAGNQGDVSRSTSEQEDVRDLQDYYAFNVIAHILLNNQLFRFFPEGSVKQRVVVSVTSFTALAPFHSSALLSSQKACTDELNRTLALEEKSIRVLLYDPGEMMTWFIFEYQHNSLDTAGNRLLDHTIQGKQPEKWFHLEEQSATKLAEVLQANTFVSGSRVVNDTRLMKPEFLGGNSSKFLENIRAYEKRQEQGKSMKQKTLGN